MKRILLLTLIIGLIACFVGQAVAHVSPRNKHHVLVIGTNSNSVFPGDAGAGYSGQSLVWLLDKLGFRVTMWGNTSGTFDATEQALLSVSSDTYDGMFLCDVHMVNHWTLIRDVRAAALSTGIPTYISARISSNGSVGSWAAGGYVNGSLNYDIYWSPTDTVCPTTTPQFGSGDTLYAHGYFDNTRYRFQIVPDDSLLGASGLATRLIWRIDDPSKTLMWKWNNVVYLGGANPPFGSFLLASQFIRDNSFEKFVDYEPIVFYLHLDADGMDSSPYCGPDTTRWGKIAAEYRDCGLSTFYFGPWEDAFDGAICDEFVSAWPNVNDVFKLTIHGPDNARSATREWSDLTGDDEQEAFSTAYQNFGSEMTPAPDSTFGLVTVHRAGWSLTNVKFWTTKGLKVLNHMGYVSPNANNYIQNVNTMKFMRFRPFPPVGADTASWVQLSSSQNLIGDDPETYDAFYDNDSPGTRGTTCGYMIGKMASHLTYGQTFYQHVPSVSDENVIGDCLLDGVVNPFMKTCGNLFLLDNTPEKIRRYITRRPIGSGL